MLKDFLENHNIHSNANFVEYGYGQVEPNHLSAQRNGQIYAQLPAAASINVLEQGQFVKYDYAAPNGGEVNFTGRGEWMLVYNEIKLYRDHQRDCEFAMVKDNYNARVYSPYDWEKPESDIQMRYYNGTAPEVENAKEGTWMAKNPEKVTTKPDPYEDLTATEDPFHILGNYHERMMPEGTVMVPRVFKTMPGDIFTTNTINVEDASAEAPLAVGDVLCVGDDGILTPEAKAGSNAGDMRWQVARVYTMPDNQRGVKIVRII